jgi:hypothetical protein
MKSFDTGFWKLFIQKTLLYLLGTQEMYARNSLIKEVPEIL